MIVEHKTGVDPYVDRESLIIESLHQVRSIARRIHEKLPPNMSLDDLVSAGIIGLIQAVDNFDPEQNVKFRTYAEYKIRGAILDSLRELDWAPRLQRKKAKAIETAIAAAQQAVMRVPNEDEIVQCLGITVEEYREWLVDTQGLSIGSLHECAGKDSKNTLLEFVMDSESNQPGNLLERQEMERMLATVVAKLPEIERTILSLYYEGDLTPREIAPIVEMTAARVCQLRTQAILRLRAQVHRILSSRRRPK